MEPKTTKRNRITQLNDILADSQSKSYFVAAVSVLFLILFIVIGVIPAYGDVLSQYSENNTINQAIEEATQKKTDLESLLTQKTNNAEVITYLDEKILPTNNQQQDVIGEVYAEAADLNLVIANLIFAENVNIDDLETQWSLNPAVQGGQFRVEAIGSLESILGFIDYFDSTKRVYHAENVSIFGDVTSSILDSLELEGDEVIVNNVSNYKLFITLKYFYWDSSTDDTNL